MARKTVVQLTDDLTGDVLDSGETVTFGLDGTTYEIDLSAANAKALRESLSDYTKAARRVGKTTGRAGKRTQLPTAANTAEVRAWAKSQNLDVPDRGRIPKAIMDAWESREK